jgi:2,4-dienoyl-CoA reductase-like NADH-dependent reductase (Old Yellow Enzyme family)
MSDSLGDGAGDSTEAQARLYERWAQGGTAVSIIGGTAVSIIEKLGAERNGSYLSESLRAKRSNLPNDNK